MTPRILLALSLTVAVAGCSGVSESRLNPFNWFGGSESTAVTPQATTTDPRNLVSQVLSLRAEQVPGGAIIHATGLPPRQGYFNGELVQIGNAGSDGVLLYEFRNATPYRDTRVGTQQSREVIVGRFISQQTLDSVRRISVRGATNALSVRR